MNNADQEGISEGFRLAKSDRAVPGGAGAVGFATLLGFSSEPPRRVDAIYRTT